MRGLIALILLLACAAAARAHPAPNSEVHIQLAPGRATARVIIPLEELSAALGREVTGQSVAAEPGAMETYLRDHVSIRTGSDPWPLSVDAQSVVQHDDHAMLEAILRFTAPRDLSPGAVIAYDAVNHHVMSHFALAYVSDAPGEPARPLVRFQTPVREAVLIQPSASVEVVRRSTPSGWVLGAVGVFGLALIGAAALNRRRPR